RCRRCREHKKALYTGARRRWPSTAHAPAPRRPPPESACLQPLEISPVSDNMTIGHDHGHIAGSAMTKTMKASECKAKFLGVLDEVASKHERVIVTKNGKPVAEIVPFVERPKSLYGAM